MTNNKASHSVRFPGESRKYRQTRNRLLLDEIKLRNQIEKVAALRRRLPPGGEVPQDYAFEEGALDLADRATVRQVKMSDLFQRGKDSLILYNFMYRLSMNQPCPMCTSLLDSLHGSVIHAAQRINFAVVAKSPIQRICDFARERGWTSFRMLSSANNTYNRDYQGETAAGDQMTALSVFVEAVEKGKAKDLEKKRPPYLRFKRRSRIR
jgi:predicted dithiol-disulfide oxidoreductase (DUF899 family)